MMLLSLNHPENEKPDSQQQGKQPSFPSGEDLLAQVLVVEDDEQMALMIAAALEACYRVTTASDGQEGLEQALALHPDLMLCDVSMPRMSGEQLVAVLRAHPDFDDVPIVLLSGRTDEQMRIQLLRAGAQGYLVKPFNYKELRARVANLLSMRQVRQILQGEVADQSRDLASTVAMQQRELMQTLSLLKEMNARLVTLATTDALTGLPNRVLLLELIAAAVPKLVQENGGMALLKLDLDRFKEVNDTFGHQVGDQLLQQVGERLRQAVSADAIVARLGGDEFAVFLPVADEASALLVASMVGAILEEAFLVEHHQLQVEASIGIALYPAHGSDPLTLFQHVDVAMYLAKRGHERCALYDVLRDLYTPQRLELLGSLRKAIATNELRLYYQPKAELKTGLVKSVEALVRWQHPTLGFLPPDQFIPLAEQTGLIESLTHWVIETAVAQCRCWQESGVTLSVAVNLSMWNLRNDRLPDSIADLLAYYGVSPNLLSCEITESAIMADAEHTLHILNRLFSLGVHIAIDDYGTGYASLSYLKRLPADELKIDRAFVQHMTTDQADQAIVRSTVNMAHSLGIQVVAEGVEDQATWNLLASLKCDIAQGYYLSRPLPAPDLLLWLDARQKRMMTGGNLLSRIPG